MRVGCVTSGLTQGPILAPFGPTPPLVSHTSYLSLENAIDPADSDPYRSDRKGQGQSAVPGKSKC